MAASANYLISEGQGNNINYYGANTVKHVLTFILSMPFSSPLYMAGTQRQPGGQNIHYLNGLHQSDKTERKNYYPKSSFNQPINIQP